MRSAKKYKERDTSHELPGWLQELRDNLVDESSSTEPLEKPRARKSRHFQFLSWISNGVREQKWNRVRVSTVYFRTFRRTQIAISCLKTKTTKASCRRRIGTVGPRAEKFSNLLITADHKVLSEECELRNNHRYAVVVQGLATQWIQPYTCKSKSSQETEKNLMRLETKSHLYRPFLRKFGKSCEELSWNHCTSTPHRSETNVIAEKAVHRVKEGTSVGAIAVRSRWRMVVGIFGMLYLSAKHSRSLVWWEDTM